MTITLSPGGALAALISRAEAASASERIHHWTQQRDASGWHPTGRGRDAAMRADQFRHARLQRTLETDLSRRRRAMPINPTKPLPRLTRVALIAASRGFPVFPLWPHGRTPAIKQWESWATTESATIMTTWAELPYNVAIATGPADLVVIDLDDAVGHGHGELAPGTPAHGRQSLAQAALEAGEPYPSATYTVRTPGGGLHLYFRTPTDRRLRNTQSRLPLIDSRADGGFIIAAGSKTASGLYRAVNRAPVQPLPLWLVEVLTPPPPPSANPVRLISGSADAYHDAALDDEACKVITAPPGLRRATLLRAASRMGRLPGLDEAKITAKLTCASDDHVTSGAYSRCEQERAISDGIAWGRKHLRDVTYFAS